MTFSAPAPATGGGTSAHWQVTAQLQRKGIASAEENIWKRRDIGHPKDAHVLGDFAPYFKLDLEQFTFRPEQV